MRHSQRLIWVWLVAVTAASDTSGQERAISSIQADCRAYVERFGSTSEFEMRSSNMLDMMWLHVEAVTHSQFACSDELQSVRRVLSARLRSGMADMRRELMKRSRRSQSGAHGSQDVVRETGGASWGTTGRGISQSELDQWSHYHGYRADRWTGGVNQYLGYLQGNFAPPGHHADALIRMIERTISPDSWQRNGGNSVIEYYGPAMVLVIRADQRTHDEVSDLLETLRDWGR